MAYSVSTDIAFGNAGDIAIQQRGSVAEVAFTPEPRGGPEVMWFCFRLLRTSDGADAGSQPPRVRLVWRNYENALGASNSATIRPVVREAGGDWCRLPAGERVEHPDGRAWLVWEVTAPGPGRWLEMALCYPYGPDDVARLIAESEEYWRADTIGLSQSGRPLVRLSNGSGKPGDARPGLFIIARQHAGETPGSWVVDGLLRSLAAAAGAGREVPLTWCVPLADIDGVIEGAYGKDRFPYDLNRAWDRPAMRHEALVIQRDLDRWAQRCRPTLVLDAHAPGLSEAQGVYAYLPDPDETPRRTELSRPWCERLHRSIGDELAAGNFGRVAKYRSRWTTPGFTAFAGMTYDCAALAIETPYALAADGACLLTQERYREVGERICQILVDSRKGA